MDDPISGWLLPVSMFALMSGMGLALTAEDFRRILRVPGPVVVGTALQLVVMPAIGFAIALLYELPPLLAVGLVILAACPGGMLSNLIVHMGRANTALSITLTATATTVTLFTLPLWVRAVLARTGGAETAVEVPLLATAAELASLTLLPVLIGMAVRACWPAGQRLERPLSLLATAGIVGDVAVAALRRPDPPTALFAASLAPALWLVAASLVLGLGVPWLLRQRSGDAVTIAVELCVKNGLLGMVVAAGTFGVVEPSIPILVYSGFMLPLAIALLAGHRALAADRAARLRAP